VFVILLQLTLIAVSIASILQQPASNMHTSQTSSSSCLLIVEVLVGCNVLLTAVVYVCWLSLQVQQELEVIQLKKQ
jgi:hypothetical protein